MVYHYKPAHRLRQITISISHPFTKYWIQLEKNTQQQNSWNITTTYYWQWTITKFWDFGTFESMIWPQWCILSGSFNVSVTCSCSMTSGRFCVISFVELGLQEISIISFSSAYFFIGVNGKFHNYPLIYIKNHVVSLIFFSIIENFNV